MEKFLPLTFVDSLTVNNKIDKDEQIKIIQKLKNIDSSLVNIVMNNYFHYISKFDIDLFKEVITFIEDYEDSDRKNKTKDIFLTSLREKFIEKYKHIFIEKGIKIENIQNKDLFLLLHTYKTFGYNLNKENISILNNNKYINIFGSLQIVRMMTHSINPEEVLNADIEKMDILNNIDKKFLEKNSNGIKIIKEESLLISLKVSIFYFNYFIDKFRNKLENINLNVTFFKNKRGGYLNIAEISKLIKLISEDDTILSLYKKAQDLGLSYYEVFLKEENKN